MTQALWLVVPGRFPTVAFDPGEWWPRALAGGHDVAAYSANVAFWEGLCGSDTLAPLRRAETYETTEAYVDAITPLAGAIEGRNATQDELAFSVEHGVRVVGLDYGDSAAVVAYAAADTALRDLVRASLPRAVHAGLVVMAVTCPEELLTALIAARLLKSERPALHVCLADHGHETFTLAAHLDRLREAGTLDSVFDTIVESKQERDEVLPALLDALDRGERPRGYLRVGDLLPARLALSTGEVGATAARALAQVPTFTPEPVVCTRLSPRRCYWSRCTFCVHNLKHEAPESPHRAEIPAAVARLARMQRAGARSFSFIDEALPPAFLHEFCDAAIEADLDITWTCRCKLERSFTPELCDKLAAAGCHEVLFGLESVSPRVLALMDKVVPGLGPAEIAQVFRRLDAAGIALHVNLIANFPGESLEETNASVEFVIRSLESLDSPTFALNRFVLFPGTPIGDDPARFEIALVPPRGDMPVALGYRVTADAKSETDAIDRALPTLRRRMNERLGWGGLGDTAAGRLAMHLYFTTGHSVVLKSRAGDNPFSSGYTLVPSR